jgi:hypothetical protein
LTPRAWRLALVGMNDRRSLLEIAQQALSDAEAKFQESPTDENERVRGARNLVASEEARERKHGGPIRPPDNLA